MTRAEAEAPAANLLEVIEFEIDEKDASGGIVSNYYGINVNKVREVIKTPAIAHASREHPAIEGMLDLRGDVIPVINLPRWLGKWEPSFRYGRTVIVEFNMLRAGFLVSRVNRIHRIPFDQLSPPASFMAQGKQMAATGLYRNQGHIVLMLDLEKLLADIDPESASIPPVLETAPVPGNTVLVVDDSPLTRTLLEKGLRGAEYDVLTVNNGAEALNLLAELHRQAEDVRRPISSFVNAVIADIEMPLVDGIRMAAMIKADKRFEGLPVIVYSSMVTPERLAQWKDAGIDDGVPKPQMAKLIATLNRISGH